MSLFARTSGSVLPKFVRNVQVRAFAVKFQEEKDVILENLQGSDANISVISLNRAKQKNALSKSLVNHLNDALADVDSSNARVLVIRSNVPGAFCVGADLKERLSMPNKEVSQFTNTLRSLMSRIYYLKVPVIAAIDGFALGGGLEMALACDIRVAASTAKMGLVETKLAIIPGAGGTIRLPRIINPAIAKELIFTAKVLHGDEARKLDLVNHVVQQNGDGDAAYQKSLEVAREILPNGPVAIRMAKFAINRGSEMDINNAMALEEACYAQIIPTKDRMEGLKAFNEKRTPKYLGE